MGYETILTALADPTRRAVLDRLRDGPKPVGRIAEGLPVTRPAVSQHLKVCLDAGLVTMDRQGTRNLYSLAPGGASDLVDWLGALQAADAADGEETGRDTRLTLHEAWTLFWDDLSVWWPVARVSLSARQDGALPQTVSLDQRSGGMLRETLADGKIGGWATIRALDPPSRLVLDWTLGTTERIEVAFRAGSAGTRVTLRHGGGQPDMWEAVLDRYAAAANSSLSNF
ncbi:MAG: metalloregulator ArsR/SmtB family transcription factor [Pseudomonadota bacterium]